MWHRGPAIDWSHVLTLCVLSAPPVPIAQGYIVHGIIRRSSSFNTGRIEHLYKDKHSDTVRTWLTHDPVAGA